jgi:hypothetical protein
MTLEDDEDEDYIFFARCAFAVLIAGLLALVVFLFWKDY